MAEVPDELQYTADHEWVRGEASVDGIVTVGITEFAADALGDVVYVETPKVGAHVVAGDVCGELESTKAVSELFSPVTGVVVEVNDELDDAPELVNADAYGDGWIFRVRVTETAKDLIDAEAYAAVCE